jgi:hypothetical protein
MAKDKDSPLYRMNLTRLSVFADTDSPLTPVDSALSIQFLILEKTSDGQEYDLPVV